MDAPRTYTRIYIWQDSSKRGTPAARLFDAPRSIAGSAVQAEADNTYGWWSTLGRRVPSTAARIVN
jgi:hypothetical protein